MNIEKLNKLCEIYHLLYEENNLAKEQKVIYNVQKFMIELNNVLTNKNLHHLINDSIIQDFQTIGANQYSLLLQKTMINLQSSKKLDITIDFLAKLDQLLESDRLELYLYQYIKDNDLEEDLKHYDYYRVCLEKKENLKKKYKRKKNSRLVLFIFLITMFFIPLFVVLFDLGEDGNTFNLISTIINIATFSVCITLFVLCHKLFIRKKIGNTFFKTLLDFFVIIVLFVPSIFISSFGATVFFMIAIISIILLNMQDRIIKLENEIKNNREFSNIFKTNNSDEILKLAFTEKASLGPSILGLLIYPFLKNFRGRNSFLKDIIQIISARKKINKSDYPDHLIDFNSKKGIISINLIDYKTDIDINDISHIDYEKLKNHDYNIGDIEVKSDCVEAILIHLKNGETLPLYFVKDPENEAKKLSSLISNI